MKEKGPGAQLPLPALPDREGARVIHLKPASRAATEQASSRPRRDSLWYALYFPQLQALNEEQQQAALRQLAETVVRVSSSISYHPRALVAEVRSSLNYFGGLAALHRQLQGPLQESLQELELPPHFHYAAAVTVHGSLLLARGGLNAAVYQRDNLRSALGHLPCEVLQLNAEQNRRLYNMGVRRLQDLWRLPMDGLRRRFGSELVTLLNKALGKAPEPTRNYLPAPAFETSYELPYGVENLERLLPVADEMLGQLSDFLRRRDLATDRLLFMLQHENREATRLELGLRQASRNAAHLLQLLQTHFGKLTIPAPVSSLKLTVLQFDAFSGKSESLLTQDRPRSDGNLDLFMEQLRARLGGQALKTIHSVAEHCPEYACRLSDYGSDKQGRQKQAVSDRPRPLWLLPQPQLLTLRGSRLYHRQAISLVSGPERIETRWWSGEDIRRDYYVAREASGARLWIFRERSAQRRWFLHGIFA
jgi:protein ImuB